MNFNKIENDIQNLIDLGRLKNEEQLKNIPINDLCKKYNLCIKDTICYFCYKEHGNTCKKECCINK